MLSIMTVEGLDFSHLMQQNVTAMKNNICMNLFGANLLFNLSLSNASYTLMYKVTRNGCLSK